MLCCMLALHTECSLGDSRRRSAATPQQSQQLHLLKQTHSAHGNMQPHCTYCALPGRISHARSSRVAIWAWAHRSALPGIK
jgi:hypothetical protein